MIDCGGIGNYCIVSDAAYGLKNYIYVPFRATPGQLLPDAQAVWNKQQSRARMIVEQVNGRLKTKWRILDARMECHRRHVPATVAAVTSHAPSPWCVHCGEIHPAEHRGIERLRARVARLADEAESALTPRGGLVQGPSTVKAK
ncbi:unnamed protein product [Closterium sp. NIES-64]|nr:unnamed protein product [Closterium sp. NIES-64]